MDTNGLSVVNVWSNPTCTRIDINVYGGINMVEEKTYTLKEVNEIASALRERQETLEALECARFIMIETKQYPRFIARITHIITSIEGAPEEEVSKEKVKVIQAPHVAEPEKPEKDETGQTKFKTIKQVK
jgi:hypothetical protein